MLKGMWYPFRIWGLNDSSGGVFKNLERPKLQWSIMHFHHVQQFQVAILLSRMRSEKTELREACGRSHSCLACDIYWEWRGYLVGAFNTSEKYEFVTWDDDIPNISGKRKKCSSHQQPDTRPGTNIWMAVTSTREIHLPLTKLRSLLGASWPGDSVLSSNMIQQSPGSKSP